MTQPHRLSQTLPRITAVTSRPHDAQRTYCAADTRAAALLTGEWTGTATLRRVYAPSPPNRAIDKAGKWRGRSPAPAKEESPSRGQGHHLSPLNASDTAQKSRYDIDALRFLSAVEESQRTAIKFEERRRRLYTQRLGVNEQRVLEAHPPNRALHAEEAEEPRAMECAQVPALRLFAFEESAASVPVPSRPSRRSLRAQRELVAGQLVDSLVQKQCEDRRSRQRRCASPPPLACLTSQEEQLPTFRATEASTPARSADTTAVDEELWRLRAGLAASLVNSWWPTYEAAATSPTSLDVTRVKELPVLRAVSEEDPRTPLERQASDADLRRARQREAARWVNGAFESRNTAPSHPQLQSFESDLAHERFRASSLTHEVGRTFSVDHGKTSEDADALRCARQAEASAWVSEALRVHDSASPTTTADHEGQMQHVKQQEEKVTLHSPACQLPRIVEYVTELPRGRANELPMSSSDAENDHKTDEEDLREVRRKEAAALVGDVLQQHHLARSVPQPVANDAELSSGSSAVLPVLRSLAMELPHAPHPITEAVEETKQQPAGYLAREDATGNGARNGLREARLAESAVWVGDAFQHQCSQPAALRAVDEGDSPAKSTRSSVAKSSRVSIEAAPSLHQLRRSLAALWVDAALTFTSVPAPEAALTNGTLGSTKKRSLSPLQGTSRQSVELARRQVAGDPADSLAFDNDAFASEGAEECLYGDHAQHFNPGPLRASLATVTAAVHAVAQASRQGHSGALYEGRRALAVALVADVCQPLPVQRVSAVGLSPTHPHTLREARCKVADAFVAAIV